MAYGVHKINQDFYIAEGLRALSRTNSGGDTNATTYATGASTTTYLSSEVFDLTAMAASILTVVSAGTVGTSLDGFWVESDDQITWTLVASGAITQLTAAGERRLEKNDRSFTKRYAKFLTTLGGTCVYCVYHVAQKRLISGS